MSGNQNPDFTEDATVQRDEQGRVSKVNMKLGASDKQKVSEPAPSASDAFQAEIETASNMLISNNLDLIGRGLGREDYYDYDQETQALVFHFEDGRKVISKGELLASFDPGPGSFMWAWANPSIASTEDAVAPKLKQKGEALNEDLLTEPKQSIPFSEIVGLMAYAMKEGGFDGIYRAMINGYVSAFIGYRLESFFDAKGNKIGETSFAGEVDEDRLTLAQEICAAYDAEMLEIDKAFKAQGDDADMDAFLVKKDEVYEKFWHRDDDYWRPCSFSWPSDHDKNQYDVFFNTQSDNHSFLIGAISGIHKTIYQVKFLDGEPKIIDQIIEWGDGFIWPQG